MTSKTRVDVLMTAYNAEAHIEAALEGLRAQTLRDIRIIIVDDGSTDATPAILARAAKADERILVITQPNAGIVAASQTGLAHCSAPVLARHDADDISDPDRLQRQVEYLDAHPECVAVASMARHIDDKGRDLGTITRRKDPKRADPFFVPPIEPYLMHPFLMMQRKAFDTVGGYRPLIGAEDSDLYWRLAEVGQLINMPAVLGSYRMHGASISSSSVVHGRRLAACAVIAALSAQRQRCKQDDLVPTTTLMQRVSGATELHNLVSAVADQLSASERAWFEIALAAKLVELAFYRPFEPTVEDARFMQGAFSAHWHILSEDNARILRESLVGTATRLALKGLLRQAAFIVPRTTYPLVLLRVMFRVALPARVKTILKQRTGRTVAI